MPVFFIVCENLKGLVHKVFPSSMNTHQVYRASEKKMSKKRVAALQMNQYNLQHQKGDRYGK